MPRSPYKHRHGSQANRVYTTLRKKIQNGQLSEGTRLLEAELARSMGVSRTPVREALRRLQDEGFVERLPDRGLVVSELTIEAILELYEILTALEGTAARLAARLITPLELERLRKTQLEVEQALEDISPKALNNLSLRFHQQICSAAKSRYLIEFTQRIYDTIERFKETTLAYPGRPQEMVLEHRAILAALEARDEELAEKLSREHNRKVMATRIAMIK